MNTEHKSAELQEYDALYASGDYSGGRAGYKNNFIRFIGESLKRLPLSRPKILDIGCGDGFFTETLAKYGDVTATDFSEAGLKRASERLPAVKFFAHDLGQPFPLEADSFDAGGARKFWNTYSPRPSQRERSSACSSQAAFS